MIFITCNKFSLEITFHQFPLMDGWVGRRSKLPLGGRVADVSYLYGDFSLDGNVEQVMRVVNFKSKITSVLQLCLYHSY